MRPLSKIALVSFGGSLLLTGADNGADRIRQAMQSSLDRQKSSIRLQVQNAQTSPAAGFFVVEWPAAPKLETSTPDCAVLEPDRLSRIIEDHAGREGVSVPLVRAVVQQESGGKPCAVSPRGAQGLMQLMPATAVEMAVNDVFDPEQNLSGGVKYLKQLLAKFGGNIELALGAYNSGAGRVERAGGVPDLPETKQYVENIMKMLKTSAP